MRKKIYRITLILGLFSLALSAGLITLILKDNAYLLIDPAPVSYTHLATIYCAYYAFGGIGNTLALNLMSLRSKSNKIKGLSRASIAPSIFNIDVYKRQFQI